MSEMGGDNDSGVPLIETIQDPETATSPSIKRKREDDNDDDDVKSQSKRAAKRKARKSTSKPKDISDEALDAELAVNHALSHMDNQLLADHIAQRTKRFQPELSLVEAEDVHVPAHAIVDTTTWSRNRTVDELPAFLEKFAGSRRKRKGRKLTDAAIEMGSPHTLVVTAAGLRAADLTRALRKYQSKNIVVAKLFAKHIKLHEAVQGVKKTRMSVGVGTPQRLIDLLDDGALSAEHLERVVVDASHIDQKKRGILDMRETLVPLVQLLTRKGLKARYGSDAVGEEIELLFF